MSHFSPVSDWRLVNNISSYITAISLKPIRFNSSKLILALTTPVMCWILDIHPSVSRKSNSTGLIDTKWRIGYKTSFISLRGTMLISLWFKIPIIIIGEIPCHDRIIIYNTYIDCILKISSPNWWASWWYNS